MECNREYDELMSLKLDGLLDPKGEEALQSHVASCSACAQLWAAMRQADSLLCASALAPLPVPATFRAEVMVRIAAIPQSSERSEVRNPQSVVPSPTRRLDESVAGIPYLPREWQGRLAAYARGIAAVALSLAGTAGLLLALLVTGVLQVEGPTATLVEALRTIFSAAETWVRSLFASSAAGLLTVGALVLALLALVGWQVVASYQRLAAQQRGKTAYLEAAA
jgi:anti-sigma factor RsiW